MGVDQSSAEHTTVPQRKFCSAIPFAEQQASLNSERLVGIQIAPAFLSPIATQANCGGDSGKRFRPCTPVSAGDVPSLTAGGSPTIPRQHGARQLQAEPCKTSIRLNKALTVATQNGTSPCAKWQYSLKEDSVNCFEPCGLLAVIAAVVAQDVRAALQCVVSSYGTQVRSSKRHRRRH